MIRKSMKIIIGTRSSALALWQTEFIKNALQRNYENLSVSVVKISTKGDRILDRALSEIGDKGLFTKEIENALLRKKIDLAVHSLKDLQTELPDGLELAAVTRRHPVEDVIIARKKGVRINSLPPGAAIATGSLRRRSQLLHLRPDLLIEDLRGNISTRIRKFLDSEWDAIILARAGVERLGLKKYISSVIPLNEITPAPGQGALGLQIRKEDLHLREILQSVNDPDTFLATQSERSFLNVLGGGCQVPVGAFAKSSRTGLYLQGFAGSPDGELIFRGRIRGGRQDAVLLGSVLAREFIRAGADKIL